MEYQLTKFVVSYQVEIGKKFVILFEILAWINFDINIVNSVKKKKCETMNKLVRCNATILFNLEILDVKISGLHGIFYFL